MTQICTEILTTDTERYCSKEIQNLKFVEIRGGRCSGFHPPYIAVHWDHSLFKHSLHFKQKLR